MDECGRSSGVKGHVEGHEMRRSSESGTGDFFCIKSLTDILNRQPSHQHISSPTSVTNTDVVVLWRTCISSICDFQRSTSMLVMDAGDGCWRRNMLVTTFGC